MVVYSIKDIEKLSGVKAHTIRMWERRYGVIQPKRTSKNIRYYDDDDLKLILNIALLNRSGIKISHISSMEPQEIIDKVSEITEVDSMFESELDALTLSILEMEEDKFVRILNKKIESLGFENTMNEVIYPLLDKLSTMWIAGSIKGAHEHFVSNIIRRKIIKAIEDESATEQRQDMKCLIFLPENENHELSLLFLHYILKKIGLRTISLGFGIPVMDALEAYNIYKPDFVFSIINDSYAEEPIQEFIDIMAPNMPEAQLILSGYQTIKQRFKLPPNCKVIKGISEVKQLFQRVAS